MSRWNFVGLVGVIGLGIIACFIPLPSEKRYHEEGQVAAKAGIPTSANPYRGSSDDISGGFGGPTKASQWLKGYISVKQEKGHD